MTSDWKECRIGDLCSKVTSGGTPKSTNLEYYTGGTIPWLNTKEVRFNRIYSTEKYITELGLQNSAAKWIKENNVIVAMYGATAGNIAINKIPLTTNQACCNLEIDENIADYRFVYYYLLDKYAILASMANGGAQQNLNSLQIKDFTIKMPRLEIQQMIAQVLSAIDDKIELNNKINANLEEQIKSIYKNINIDNDNETLISNIIDVRDGTHDSPKTKSEGKKLITSKHLLNYGVDKTSSNYISEKDYIKINERSAVNTGDILISMIGTVGIVSLIIENPVDFAVKNVGIYRTSLNPNLQYYIHCFLKSENTQGYIASHLAGTTQKYISLGELRNLSLSIPSNDELEKFNKIVTPMYSKIISNTRENQNLIQLRDTLLPKLMNGEIDVEKVDITNDSILCVENKE